jgi:hypothetical protein
VRKETQRVVLAGGAAALLLVGIVGAVLLLRAPSAAQAKLAHPPIDVRAWFTPNDPQFGDVVVAHVEAIVDTTRVDPASVNPLPRLAPFLVVRETRTVHRAGHVADVRFDEQLQCLTVYCVPAHDVLKPKFKPLVVRFADRGKRGTASLDWPTLTVHSRLTAATRAHPTVRFGPPLSTPASYRVRPHTAGMVALVVALVLGLAGIALLLWLALGPLLERRRGPNPVERILRELQAQTNGDSGHRRAALEQLARELAPLDRDLSRESRTLAWAPDDPPRDAIDELARRAREANR